MSKKGVTGKWVVLAGILMAFSLSLAAWGTFWFITSIMNMFPYRTAIPGQAEFYLPKAGQYDVAVEDRWTDSNGLHFTRIRGDMEVQLIQKATGRRLELRPMINSFVYTIGERHGTVLYHVDVPQAGAYVLKGRFVSPSSSTTEGLGEGASAASSAACLALGLGFNVKALLLFIAGCIALPLFFTLFIILLIFYLVGRARRNREAAAAQALPPVPPSPPPSR